MEELFEAWSGAQAGVDEVASGEQERGFDGLFGGGLELAFGEVVEAQVAVSGAGVHPVELQVFGKVGKAEEAL